MLRNEDDVYSAIDWWNVELETFKWQPLRSYWAVAVFVSCTLLLGRESDSTGFPSTV